jgi:hypothetical protein
LSSLFNWKPEATISKAEKVKKIFFIWQKYQK